MTTVVARFTALILLFTAIPLPGEVFAQVDESAEATTTEEVLASEPEDVDELWYKSERIFGNIDVGDFVVGPGRSEVEVRPGETIVQEITVTNRISDDREFKIEVEDIRGTRNGEAVVSVGAGERGPYSIQDYVSIPNDTLRLKLGERARIPITISVPADAEPGGYYGSVLVSTIRRGEDGELAPRSPIIARIGSLFFITIPGDIEKGGELVDLSMVDGGEWWYEKGPVTIGLLYENKGSVHLNPYGQISVWNMFGEEVGFVELEPWFVLPQSLRLREIIWDREFLFGRYTVEAQINRGYDDIVDTKTVTFWVLPWKIVGGGFLVLFIIIFGIRSFFRTFEFKKRGS